MARPEILSDFGGRMTSTAKYSQLERDFLRAERHVVYCAEMWADEAPGPDRAAELRDAVAWMRKARTALLSAELPTAE